MKTLNFITSNKGKIDVLNQFVDEFSHEINFEMLNLSFEELKLDDSLKKTALNKAKTCIKLSKKENVVVSDVGIFIESLNGFPGVNTGFTIRTIGNEGILKLMKGSLNRNAIFQMAIAYIDKRNRTKVFSAQSEITIANNIGGKNGFGWDKIALGNKERFSDNLNNEKRLSPFKKTIRLLVDYINNLDNIKKYK